MKRFLVVSLWLSLASTASAQVASAGGRYFDRGHWLVARAAPNGGLAIVRDDGLRFDAALGTDRVLVSGPAGAWAQLDLVVDEVLSARAEIVAVRSARGEDPFALAERLAPLVERGVLRAAMPDLAFAHARASIAVPPNDPSYRGQWFWQTLHMEDAWRHEDGDPAVTIAVVDDGCDLTHPDLSPHMLQGYDAFDDDTDPSYLPMTSGNNHGTSCAGLVAAATDNGIDVAGACPECSLRCVRLLGPDGSLIPTSTDVRAYDFVLMHADVAVVSNSWGFTTGIPAPGPLVDVLNMVQTQGHGGTGALVVFAAGNDSRTIGADELEAIPGLVTVGAINTFDEAANFSNMGQCLALVAPTGTLTTDIAGADGADPGDTTDRFGGTSSACPIVAGIAGLMASRRPTMSAADLRAALIATVRRAPFASPDAMGHDVLYGFGIVDPAAALARIDPAGVPDAGPSDAGLRDAGSGDAGVDGGASPSPGSGCGCRAAGTGSGSGLALLALVLALARRRRLLALTLAACVLGCAADPIAATPAIAELRPDTPGSTDGAPYFASTETVESIVSPAGAFRIHFTRAGTNAVPAADTDGNGTPDYVDLVALQYDMVLARYTAMGFRAPRADTTVPIDHGGDGLFDVYLLDFTVATGGGADGSFRREDCVPGTGCTGYMLQENDFVGFGYPSVHYGARLLASHEFFHAVQAAYDDQLAVQGSTLAESTAVWASERFDPAQTDMESFASAFLARPDHALGVDSIGPVQPYAYGSAIVWEYYTTRFDDALVVHFWNQLDVTAGASTSNWLDVLDTVLARDYATTFHASYVDFAEWLVFTGGRVDPTHGPRRGEQFAEVATMSVTLPYHTLSTRIFPASAHYFSVASNHVSVRLTGATPAGVDVITVAFAGGRFVRDARGQGQVDLMAAGADTIIVVLANGATSGSSDAVSICIAGLASDCAESLDAGVPADASATPDAGAAPVPAPGCACRAGAGSGCGAVSWALGVLVLLARLPRRRSPRTHRALCRSSVTT